jgi:hypothetical protein
MLGRANSDVGTPGGIAFSLDTDRALSTHHALIVGRYLLP